MYLSEYKARQIKELAQDIANVATMETCAIQELVNLVKENWQVKHWFYSWVQSSAMDIVFIMTVHAKSKYITKDQARQVTELAQDIAKKSRMETCAIQELVKLYNENWRVRLWFETWIENSANSIVRLMGGKVPTATETIGENPTEPDTAELDTANTAQPTNEADTTQEETNNNDQGDNEDIAEYHTHENQETLDTLRKCVECSVIYGRECKYGESQDDACGGECWTMEGVKAAIGIAVWLLAEKIRELNYAMKLEESQITNIDYAEAVTEAIKAIETFGKKYSALPY